MKNLLPFFFDFSARERNGAFVLVILIAALSCIKVWLIWHRPEVDATDFADVELKLALYEWQSAEDLEEEYGKRIEGLPDEDQHATPAMNDFDPNTVTEDELRSMGMDTKIARTLINYRSKGATFKKAEDLKKIYGMSEGEYNRLLPFVIIGEEFLHAAPGTVISKIEINAADSMSLTRLRGIGPVLASRIVKYRNLLGGYAITRQLGEVYGISDSLLLNLEGYVFADTALLVKLDINHATAFELSQHPYITSYDAEGIILYREYADTIRSVEELVLNGLMSADKAEKLKAYIMF